MNKIASDSNLNNSPALKSWAVYSWKAILLFVVIASFSAVSDLWTKHWAFEKMNSNNKPLVEKIEKLKQIANQQNFDGNPNLKSVLEKAKTDPNATRGIISLIQQSDKPQLKTRICHGLSITLSTNPGVVFGISWLPRPIVNMITFAMIIVIIAYFVFSSSKNWVLHIALALILGGAIGNLYDRLFSVVALPDAGFAPIKGHVRDFLDCSDFGYVWIFNVADAWLVVGVAIIFIQSIFIEIKQKRAAKASETTKNSDSTQTADQS